jgi:hypothetical protein
MKSKRLAAATSTQTAERERILLFLIHIINHINIDNKDIERERERIA